MKKQCDILCTQASLSLTKIQRGKTKNGIKHDRQSDALSPFFHIHNWTRAQVPLSDAPIVLLHTCICTKRFTKDRSTWDERTDRERQYSQRSQELYIVQYSFFSISNSRIKNAQKNSQLLYMQAGSSHSELLYFSFIWIAENYDLSTMQIGWMDRLSRWFFLKYPIQL